MAPRDYGSLNGGEQVPLIPMHIIDSIDEKSSSTKGDSHCQSLAKKLAFYGSLTTAAVLLTTWLGFFHGTAPLDPAPPYAPTQHAHHAHHAQLSSLLLSPIDMGVPSVDRSDDRLPGNVWGTKLLEDPKTGFKKPLPTNVWYLVSFNVLVIVQVLLVSDLINLINLPLSVVLHFRISYPEMPARDPL